MNNEPPMRRPDSTSEDEVLMAHLSELFSRDDGPPAEVVAMARQLFGLRTLDAELAALTADSLVEQGTSGLRSDNDSGVRLLSFEAGALAVEIEVSGSARQRHLEGQLIPAGPGRIEIRGLPGVESRWVEVDSQGRFAIDRIAQGPISVRVHRPGQRPVATEWTIVQ